jgi:predicted phage baseplate assembly protein
MALPAPVLDDRAFEDLVAEARSLIPRYAPAWTNHNESDPGITLLQLFAWFTDLLLYRVKQVPELSYIKFLELLGIQQRPATPARVELTFTTARLDLDVTVPAGTQVATAGGEGGPVVFELPRAFVAIGPRLAAVQVYDGFAHRDVTTANAVPGQSIEPFGPHTHPRSALMLGFDTPAAMTAEPITLFAYQRQPRDQIVVKGGFDLDAVPPPATLAYEYWDGSGWNTLSLEVDETRAFTRTGAIVVNGPGMRSGRAALGIVTARLHWFRIRLEDGAFDRAPELSALAVNTVPAIQAVTLRDEVLGGSDGMPRQGPFQLSTVPVVREDAPRTVVRGDGIAVTVTSLELEIDEGGGFEPWQDVDDFSASGPDDPHYVLDRTTGELRFGDGRRGRIPVANPALPTANIVARRYRAGGGARGNAGAATITTLQTAAPGIATVTNARAATGGAEQETVADAKDRAPSALKARGRAVTAGDFETLAGEAPAAIKRAKALPLHHPAFADVAVPGAVTVIVVPDAPGSAPRPSEGTLRTVCAYLDRHRLITTEVFVTGPTYRRVLINGDVVVLADNDLAAVRRDVAARLTEWLHPLTGGDDGRGWEFGGTISASGLFRVVLGVKGVDRLRDNQLTVVLDGEPQTFCRDVEIGPGELLEPLEPELRVSYR